MSKKISQSIGVLILIVAVVAVLLWVMQAPDETGNGDTTPDDTSIEHELISVDSPGVNETVSSPLEITGEARGTWYFEATFPIRIVDADGNELGTHFATAQDEWMTEDFVPFSAELSFAAPNTETGELILERANPSGLEENADEVRIPVRFSDDTPVERTVQIYHYDPDLDTDASGNIMCSDAGLVAVERTITEVQTPLTRSIELLLEGDLTAEEEAAGITTEFPLDGFSLESASITDGVATLEFADPNNSSSGGSCRAGILYTQIEATATQFDTVDSVQIIPEEILQP